MNLKAKLQSKEPLQSAAILDVCLDAHTGFIYIILKDMNKHN